MRSLVGIIRKVAIGLTFMSFWWLSLGLLHAQAGSQAANNWQDAADLADYQKASNLLLAEIRQNDRFPEKRRQLQFELSRILLHQNEYRKALQLIEHLRPEIRQADKIEKALMLEAYADLALEISVKSLREKAVAALELAIRLAQADQSILPRLNSKLAQATRLAGNRQQASQLYAANAKALADSDQLEYLFMLQDWGYCQFLLGDTALMRKLYLRADSLQSSLARVPIELQIRQQFYLGHMGIYANDQESARFHLDACIQLAEAHPQAHTILIAYGYNFRARLEEESGNFRKAVKIRKKQIEALKRNGTNAAALAEAYRNLGSNYQRLGKNSLALSCRRTSVETFPLEDPIHRKRYAVQVADYAQMLQAANQWEEAIRYSDIAIAEVQRYDSANYNLLGYLNKNRGSIFSQQRKYDRAQASFESSAKYLEAAQPKRWHLQAGAMALTAQACCAQQACEQAKKHYLDAKQMFAAHPVDDVDEAVVTLRDIAHFESEYLHDHELALRTLQQGFGLILSESAEMQHLHCPSLSNYLLAGPAIQLSTDKLRILKRLHAQTGDASLLQNALDCGLGAMDLVRQLRQEQNADEDKLRINRDWRELYDMCLGLCFELHRQTGQVQYLHQAFEISEQSKAMILMAAVLENRDPSQDAVSAALLAKKQALLAEMNALRKQIKGGGPNTARAQLIELNTRYESLIDSLNQRDPKYVSTVYGFKIANVGALQDRLSQQNSGFLEYYYSDQAIYAFAITPDTFLAKQVRIEASFTDSLEAYIQAMKQLPDAGEDAKTFAQNGIQLFQHLWILPANAPEKVTIIPDGPLSFLSFEAICHAAPDRKHLEFKDLHFLVEQFNISYNYSGTFLLNSLHDQQEGVAKLLALAPSFDGFEKLRPLPEAKASVEQIGQMFPDSKVLTGTEANKANFLQLAKSFDIIDLATHGIADSSNSLDSRLFFSIDGKGDSILYLSELYNLKLPIRLAILEACETGTGDFNQGEGVTSLARGFTYAGCRSILMSLWQVPEGNSTSEIMKEFYLQMAAGKDLDEAIVLAKRQYLDHLRQEGGGNLWQLHPFFWAELVLIGDKEAIEMSAPQSLASSYLPIVGGLAACLLLAGFGLFLRKRQQIA